MTHGARECQYMFREPADRTTSGYSVLRSLPNRARDRGPIRQCPPVRINERNMARRATTMGFSMEADSMPKVPRKGSPGKPGHPSKRAARDGAPYQNPTPAIRPVSHQSLCAVLSTAISLPNRESDQCLNPMGVLDSLDRGSEQSTSAVSPPRLRGLGSSGCRSTNRGMQRGCPATQHGGPAFVRTVSDAPVTPQSPR